MDPIVDIFDHLSLLDHGSISELIGDVAIVELIDEVSSSAGKNLSRGELIFEILGGSEGLLEDTSKRKLLFESFTYDQREKFSLLLNVSNIDEFQLTNDKRAKLYHSLGLEYNNIHQEEVINDDVVEVCDVEYGLFPYQTDIVLKAIEYLSSDSPKVMMHMPTGSGKTRSAMHLISRHLNTRKKCLVVWLVSGLELCDQAVKEFKKAWHYLGERPLPVIRIAGSVSGIDIISSSDKLLRSTISKDSFKNSLWPEVLDDGIIIASVDTLRNLIQSWEPGDRIERVDKVTLIVFDEAHRSVAPTYLQTLELLNRSSSLLGLSATPGRRHYEASSEADEKLVEIFESQKVNLFIEGYESPIDGLIDQGYLARLETEKLTVINSDFEPEDIERIEKSISRNFDISPLCLKIFGLSATRNLQILDRVEKLVKDEGHQRVIVFAPSVESSILISNLLKSRDILSESVTSKTKINKRRQIIKLYKKPSSSPMVLCNYGVLSTGFDAPETSAVVIARPTKSIVLLNQMAGRATRGPKVGGNKTAKLVTILDTSIPELVDTMNQFNAFNESWKKL